MFVCACGTVAVHARARARERARPTTRGTQGNWTVKSSAMARGAAPLGGDSDAVQYFVRKNDAGGLIGHYAPADGVTVDLKVEFEPVGRSVGRSVDLPTLRCGTERRQRACLALA